MVNMNEARQQHTATLLQNGSVLMTGGFGGATDLSSAELFVPPFLVVPVDIRPKSTENRIFLSGGKVPVVILSNSDFDATTVDPLTVSLAGAAIANTNKGKLLAVVTDVDGDGLDDLLVYFSMADLELSTDDTEAFLTGETFDGIPIQGADLVQVIP